jgi:predicted nucleotidyltransferase
VTASINPHVSVTHEQIAAFCERWGITEFALFGSVARQDFRPDSDIDVMIRFRPDARRSLKDLVHMHDELIGLFGREVDIVERGQITNPYRLRSIERDLSVVYAA